MRRFLFAALAAAAPLSAHAQPGEAAARNLASTCAICHGTDGRAVTRDAVSLAGLPQQQIVARMHAFRDGTRPATVMQQIAKGYSDDEVAQLAAYFAAQTR